MNIDGDDVCDLASQLEQLRLAATRAHTIVDRRAKKGGGRAADAARIAQQFLEPLTRGLPAYVHSDDIKRAIAEQLHVHRTRAAHLWRELHDSIDREAPGALAIVLLDER